MFHLERSPQPRNAVAQELLQQYKASLGAPAAARSDLASYLVALGEEELVPTATLLTSELVTNSIVHASGEVTLRATWDEGRLRVDVMDHGGGVPTRRVPGESGRGLQILEALATRWGSNQFNGAGRATWFELERV